MIRNTFIAIVVYFVGLPALFSQNELNISDSIVSSLPLKEITVSAIRVETKKENLPQCVQVISAKEIEQTGAADLTDILKKNAGVDVIQYPGMLSGIGIRGYRPQFSGINQRTLILINGCPAGATNLAMINLDNVDQIEVLKGAASALYGAQAMGGVVNIITKDRKGEIKKSIYGSFGSFSTLELGVNAGGSISDRLSFDVNLKHFQQNEDYRMGGDNLFRKRFGWDKASLTYYNTQYEIDSVETTKDVYGDGEKRSYTKYKYQSGGVNFNYWFLKHWKASIGGTFFSATDVQTPGDIFYGNTSQSIKNPYRYGANMAVVGKIAESHEITAKAYTSLENSDYRSVNGGVVADYVTSTRTNKWLGFQLQDNISIKDHQLIIGIDQSNVVTASKSFNGDNGEEKAPYSPNYGIYSSAAFAQVHCSFLEDKLQVNAGMRADNIVFDVQPTPFLETYKIAKESYGVINPSAGVKYRFFNSFNVHASGGQAFVTPDAYNVAGYSVSGPGASDEVNGQVNIIYGNPDLKPEKGLTLDGGIGYDNPVNGFHADCSFFNTYVRDRITQGQTRILNHVVLTNDGDTVASQTTYVNADKSLMNGLEMSVSWDIGAFANYAYSFKLFINAVKYISLQNRFKNPLLTSGEAFSKGKIYNVADFSCNYGLEFEHEKFRGKVAARYVGKRYDTDWNDYLKKPEIQYNPFMIIDMSIGFKITEKGDLSIHANNITDENYYEKRGFNLPGRNLNIKYTYSF